jgi:hypothetical protein
LAVSALFSRVLLWGQAALWLAVALKPDSYFPSVARRLQSVQSVLSSSAHWRQKLRDLVQSIPELVPWLVPYLVRAP